MSPASDEAQMNEREPHDRVSYWDRSVVEQAQITNEVGRGRKSSASSNYGHD